MPEHDQRLMQASSMARAILPPNANHLHEAIDKMKHTMQKPPIRRQDGYTLIEVLIVMAIFSIGILGAMAMQTGAVTTNASSNKSTLALEYATDTMELLMSLNPSENDLFNIDDDGDGTTDEADEEDDGIDNDNDGTVDNEIVWHRLPEFQAGNGYTRGGAAYLPENAYYDSFCNLSWNITNIDCDGDAVVDAKRIDLTVAWDNGRQAHQLSNIRTNLL